MANFLLKVSSRRSLKEALFHALILNGSDKQLRMHRLYEQGEYYDIDFREDDFMKNLSVTHNEKSESIPFSSPPGNENLKRNPKYF